MRWNTCLNAVFCKGNELHFKWMEQNFVAPKSELFRLLSNECFFSGFKTCDSSKRNLIKSGLSRKITLASKSKFFISNLLAYFGWSSTATPSTATCWRSSPLVALTETSCPPGSSAAGASVAGMFSNHHDFVGEVMGPTIGGVVQTELTWAFGSA